MILKLIWMPSVEVVDHFDVSLRGEKGFGSSDKEKVDTSRGKKEFGNVHKEPVKAPPPTISEDKYPTSVPLRQLQHQLLSLTLSSLVKIHTITN